MKPFLFLSHRAENSEVQRDILNFSRYGGVRPADVLLQRLEKRPLPALNLDDYSAVIVSGGPFNISDPSKSDLQLRVEDDLRQVVQQCHERDFPFLGLCYGMGVLVNSLGGRVSRQHGEKLSTPLICLTKAGQEDPLLGHLPPAFHGFTGHKEAVEELPEEVDVLATGDKCPIQIVRVGNHLYGTQFHPEMDGPSLAARVQVYSNHGYVASGRLEDAVRWARTTNVGTESNALLRAFVRRFGR